MEIFASIIFLSATLNLFLGLLVLADNPRAKLNRLFGISSLITSLWGFANFTMGVEQTVFWVESAYAFGVLVPFMTMLWILQLCEIKIHRIFLAIVGATDLFLLLASYKKDLVIKNIGAIYPGRFEGESGILFLPYWIFIVGILLFIVYSLVRSYRKSKGDKKLQLGYVIIGTISYISVVTVGSFILPSFEIFKYTALDSPSSLFLLFFTALAITKYHLFGIKIIITEFLVFIMGMILITVPFLMPTISLKIFTFIVFVLFCFFGYYLIQATRGESRRREEAEMVAVKERELRQNAEDLAENLKHLDEAKNQFLLSTQHHLRSPLSVVQGYLSMIGEGNYGKLPAKAKDKVGVSLDATKKLICIVDELLDVAHFQMNKGIAFKESVEAVKLVGNIVADLEKNAQTKKIYLRFNPPAAPVPMINVDPRGIREAVYNIIDNAIKYTAQGGVTVTVGAGSEKLIIAVVDTGIGMNEREQIGLFNRTFERGERAKTVNANGKGIGLYLSSQIILGNGGNIRARSEGWGKGAEFIIELPLTEGKNGQNSAISIPVPRPVC